MTLSPDPNPSVDRETLAAENADLRAQVAHLKARRAALLGALIRQAKERKSLKARLAASQDRSLSIAFEREEAKMQAAKARAARDRSEEIIVGAMRYVLHRLNTTALERFDERLAVYVRELGLSAPVIYRLDGSALAVERVRRRAMRSEAA